MIGHEKTLSIMLVSTVFLTAIFIYPYLPGKIPSRWDFQGNISAYDAKSVIFLLPVIVLATHFLFEIIPKIEVYKENLEKFRKEYEELRLIIISFFAFVFIGMVIHTFIPFNMKFFLTPLIALLFWFIGDILPKTKRNFFIGIRTPWTLVNDKVWEDTHKAGEKVFKATAFVLLISFLLLPDPVWALLVMVMLVVGFVFGYSYFDYQNVIKKERRVKRKAKKGRR